MKYVSRLLFLLVALMAMTNCGQRHGTPITETDELSRRQIKAISGIKQGKNGIELTTYDKVKALELLGRHLGMFKDKVEVSGNVNNPFEGLSTEQLLRLAGEDLESE